MFLVPMTTICSKEFQEFDSVEILRNIYQIFLLNILIKKLKQLKKTDVKINSND